MRYNMEMKFTPKVEYDAARVRMEKLIAEATEKGLLEPEMDNEYTREIGALGKLMAAYEDEYLNILPLREKNPLIRSIEDYFYAHNLRQKEVAAMLGVNESVFSQIMYFYDTGGVSIHHEQVTFDRYISGTVTCTKKNGTESVLTFKNVVLQNRKDDTKVTIDGTFVCDEYRH